MKPIDVEAKLGADGDYHVAFVAPGRVLEMTFAPMYLHQVARMLLVQVLADFPPDPPAAA